MIVFFNTQKVRILVYVNQTIMKEKTIIKLRLKPYLEDFARHELTTDVKDHIILTRKSDIGKCICSHITEVDTSNFTQATERPDNKYKLVSFVLPVNAENHYIHQYRFCGVNKWSEQKINDYLETEFRQRMRLLFEAGYRCKCKQKDIIEAILDEYNIQNTAINYETVKKSDYRNQKKTRKIVFATLQAAMF
jgi:hypothetical protein